MPDETTQTADTKAAGRTARPAKKCTVHVIETRCKGCGFCIEFCPKDVLEAADRLTPNGYHPPYTARAEQCICCRMCQLVCPDFAIYITDDEPAAGSESS